eukprot:2177733-Prymnesium_polylepis.1
MAMASEEVLGDLSRTEGERMVRARARGLTGRGMWRVRLRRTWMLCHRHMVRRVLRVLMAWERMPLHPLSSLQSCG